MIRSSLFRRLGCALCVTAGSVAGLAGTNDANGHTGFDIMPYYDAANNKIAIGGVTHSTTTNPITGDSVASTKFIINEWSVFALEFGGPSSFIPGPGKTNDLGINNEPGTYTNLSTDPYSTLVQPGGNNTGFATGDVLFLQAVSSLQIWDDAVESFIGADAGTTISVEDGSILVNGAGYTNNESFPGVGVGGILAQVGNNGFHEHYSSTLSPLADGVYAFQVQAFLYGYNNSTGQVFDKGVSSDTFWLVYNYNVDEELFDEAIHFLNGDDHDHDDDVASSGVPEPATASMLAIGAVLVAMRRRR